MPFLMSLTSVTEAQLNGASLLAEIMMQFAKEFPDSQIVEDWVKIGKSSRPRRDDGIYGSESRTPGS